MILQNRSKNRNEKNSGRTNLVLGTKSLKMIVQLYC